MLCYPPPPPPSSSPPPCDMSRSQNEDKMSRCHSSLTCEDVKLSSCLSCQDVTCHARLLDCWLASFVTTDTRFGTSEGTIQCLQEISIAFWVHGFVCDDSYTVWGLLGDDAMPAGNLVLVRGGLHFFPTKSFLGLRATCTALHSIA